MSRDEDFETASLVTIEKCEQCLSIFTNVVMNINESRACWLEFGERARRNVHQVTNATNFKQNRSVVVALDYFAPKRTNHERAPTVERAID